MLGNQHLLAALNHILWHLCTFFWHKFFRSIPLQSPLSCTHQCIRSNYLDSQVNRFGHPIYIRTWISGSFEPIEYLYIKNAIFLAYRLTWAMVFTAFLISQHHGHHNKNNTNSSHIFGKFWVILQFSDCMNMVYIQNIFVVFRCKYSQTYKQSKLRKARFPNRRCAYRLFFDHIFLPKMIFCPNY